MPTKKTTKKSKVTKKTAKKPVKKAPKKVVPPAPPPVAPPAPVVVAPPTPPLMSEAERIWVEIQARPIAMFGLPNQFVLQHCTVVNVEPSACYVTIRSSATLPSLEAAVAPDFTVELADKFVIIRRVPKPLIPSKRR
jgi:hypothetical protein